MRLAIDGLDQAIAYLESIKARIVAAEHKAIKSSEALRNMEAICNDITNSTVYQSAGFVGDPSSPPQMKDGAAAEASEDGVVVGMAMDPALLTISGPSAGENTYAMFMLPEFFQHSFLPKNNLPVPFLDAWHVALAEKIPEAFSDALDKELAR